MSAEIWKTIWQVLFMFASLMFYSTRYSRDSVMSSAWSETWSSIKDKNPRPTESEYL